MKIFLSFLQSKKELPIAAHSFWEYYIKNGIEEAGDTWIECPDVDWAVGLVSQSSQDFDSWKNFSWETTIKYIKKNTPDIFLSYLYPEQIDESAILEIKKLGVFCINFFCDNVRLFQKAPRSFSVFDLNWVPEFKAIGMYRTAQFPYIHLPMPMWIEPKLRVQSTLEDNHISFIGSKDIQRQLFFERVVEIVPTIDLNIYGNGWNKENCKVNPEKQSLLKKINNQIVFIEKYGIKPYLNKLKFSSFNPEMSVSLKTLIRNRPDFEDYIRITRESKITIGINRYPSFNFPLRQPNTYSRLRDIEAPMLGACYLTEWTEGLDELYEIGTEIETFSNQEHFIEKLKELDSDPKKRLKLRINGQKRALNGNSILSSLRIIKDRFYS